MIKVNWFSLHNNNAIELSTIPLDRVTNDILDNDPNYGHYLCPAFMDSLKDTYIIRSPFNLKLSLYYNPSNGEFQYSGEGVEDHIRMRSEFPIPKTKYISFTVNHFFQFFTDNETIEIEQLPALYHRNSFTEQTQVITGRFNIGKWYRPIETASCIVPYRENVEINIKKGDALSYVRFNQPVILNRITDSKKITEILNLITACTALKRTNPKLSLKSMYELFKPFKPKKCPFKFWS